MLNIHGLCKKKPVDELKNVVFYFKQNLHMTAKW